MEEDILRKSDHDSSSIQKGSTIRLSREELRRKKRPESSLERRKNPKRKVEETWAGIEEIVFAIRGGKDTLEIFSQVFGQVGDH